MRKNKQNLKIYNNDYYIKPNNQFVFEKPGHESYSCAKWLTTDSPNASTTAITYRLSVPWTLAPDSYSAAHTYTAVQI